MRRPNRGFALIAAIILLVVAAAMAVVLATLVSSSSQSGAKHIGSAQALFIAESGLERAIRQRSLDNTYVGEGPVTMGQGSYTITVFDTDFSGAALPSGQRRLRSVGQFDTATRTVEAIVRTGAAMMVYAKETPTTPAVSDVRGIPFFRQWNNDTYAWGAEGQARDVGPNIRYLVLKFARTRNEAILGTMNSNGEIHVQIWDGTMWGATRLLANVGGGNSIYRGFDIAYEGRNDRAIVVYNDANSRNPSYQVWDGTTWTTRSILTDLGANYTSNNNAPIWIDMASDPRAGSNNMVLMTLDNANSVYGVLWNGTTWVRISGSNAPWGTTATISRKPTDVAYEQVSGRAIFIWGTTGSTTNQQRYRIWNDVTLNAPTDYDIGAMSNTANWVKLAPQPGSNNMMYGVQDSGRDLHTLFWDGTAFTSETTHDTQTEAAASRNFDIVFETHPARSGEAWLVWGTATGSDQTRRRHWNGTGWDAALAKIGDDTGFVRMAAHPASGAVFAGLYETANAATDDIQEVHLTQGSGTWSGLFQVWNGGTATDPVNFRVDIATERRSPVIAWREVFP